MSSKYMNDTLTPVSGFIDFDDDGKTIMVSQSHSVIYKQNTNLLNTQTENDTREYYECNICHKKFSKKSYWKRHELSHEEKFSCHICGAEFMHNRHLTQHMDVHKEKQFQCDVCGLQVRYKFNLTKHRKIHVPYKDDDGNIKYFTVK
jgi:uncharacterized Zn-finger protein